MVAVSLKRRALPNGSGGTKQIALIFGVGYTGERLARRLVREGRWRVWGTSRAADSRARLSAAVPGLRLFASGSEALAAASSEGVAVSHLIVTAAPGEKGDPLIAELGEQAAQLLACIPWICYLSTVGVYGDCSGAIVYEGTPLKPKSKRATLRVDAESQWASLAGGQLWILRLPGIYGPGRGPLFKARSGEARRIVAPNGHVFSRIHVDDIVGATVKAMLGGGALATCNGKQSIVVNVVDDEPAPGHQVSAFAFQLLGKEPPPCTDLDKADLSAVARSFYEESRYVLNSRLRSELGYQLIYPTFREGLQAQMAEEARAQRAAKLRTLPAQLLATVGSLVRGRRSARRAVVLVDNGSLRAESTIGLRTVAQRLGERLGADAGAALEVIPSSCRFSDRVDPGELGGERALTILGLLRDLRARRYGEVVLLPVFFGPSNLATEFIPKQVSSVASEPGPPMPSTSIAPTLICNCPFLFPNAKPDDRIAQILRERVLETAKKYSLQCAAVAVTDHGSPTKYVAQCRDMVTQQLSDLLASGSEQLNGFAPRAVAGCCMERREGPEYDFNGSLLETLLKDSDAFSKGDVIVALMFLQPGRHAGDGGDIAQIIEAAAGDGPQRRIVMTDVIGSHPLLVDILAERAGQARSPLSW